MGNIGVDKLLYSAIPRDALFLVQNVSDSCVGSFDSTAVSDVNFCICQYCLIACDNSAL